MSMTCTREAGLRDLARLAKGNTGVRKMSDLPADCRSYLARISQLVGRPVEVVSVGPDREQTILPERKN